MTSNVSRRNLLKIGGGTLVSGYALASCSFFSTQADPRSDSGGGGGRTLDARESPMLTELVESGELPAVEDRLPTNPMVIQPLGELGEYGGTLRRGHIDPNGNHLQYFGWAGLVEWSPTTPPEPVPALAEEYEVEDEGRVYVFHLREGLKWSDGQAFTTEDLMFVFEDYWNNEQLHGTTPTWLRSGGESVKLTAEGPQTIRFEFAAPNGMLLRYLSFVGTAQGFILPKHYMTQFHEKYIEKAELERLQADYEQDSFEGLFGNRADRWSNPDLPVMGAWKIVQPADGGNARAERNPYYWKVDAEGRQLPYIDAADFSFMDQEALGLRAANGDIDLATYDIGAQSITVLAENQEQNDYRLIRWAVDGQFNAIYLNLSHPDPVLRDLFQNIDFRAGVSHAINRDEINEAMLAGQGSIQHPCGQPEDPYFEDGMGMRFTEYDVDKANELLDAAGLTERDDDGFRLRPDGKPMLLAMQTFDVGVGVPMIDVLQYVKRYWAEVGINVNPKMISAQLWYEQIPQGKYDVIGYPPAGYLWDIDSLWYVPTSGLTYWAPRYGIWYGDPEAENALAPPEESDIRKTQVLYDQLVQEPDEEARLELGREILRLHDENVWIIGTIRPPFHPVVASNALANVREDAVASYRTGYESATEPAQLFFADSDRR